MLGVRAPTAACEVATDRVEFRVLRGSLLSASSGGRQRLPLRFRIPSDSKANHARRRNLTTELHHHDNIWDAEAEQDLDLNKSF
ncbi:hypothetical protein MY1884_000076 [Beauveria asiatica]